ncbi:putative quinol monooxygenase [Nocardioides marinquilinus]|uniref:Quinol monooxygenase n=1 Tax=Nocardioides marinquilinus TaxID=1210400 RepID=A0ABP9P532_9ACTN
MSLHVVATIPIDPAQAAAAAPALAALAEGSRSEEGCLSYEVFSSQAVPGVFVTIEEWRSQEDLDAHMATPHVASALEIAGPLLAGDIVIHPLAPVGG